MKIFEVLDSAKSHDVIIPIVEGGASGGVRYNSEVGLLGGFFGIDPRKFDPSKPEKFFPAESLSNPKRIYADIKTFLVPNYDASMFAKWVELGRRYGQVIAARIAQDGTQISEFGWAGGTNKSESGAVDIDFVGCDVSGVSIKAEGGITLANLTPKTLGLTPDVGNDVFYHYAQSEYIQMKNKIFSDAMAEAKALNGKPLVPIKSQNYIVYDKKTDQFSCVGKTTYTGTAKDILSKVSKNAAWQRPFGDWFQANWSTKKEYATPLYSKIAKVFEKIIEENLADSGKLASVLRFANTPYFYASSKNLYYIPSIESVSDLQLRGLTYAAPDGTSQLFGALVGRPDSKESAQIDIYIRYANGMFETNPTVRVQTLRNPQFISWEKLV